MRSQPATKTEASAVVETLTLAFMDDPVWSWAFPDADLRAEQYRAWWSMFVVASIAQDSVWISDRAGGAAAVWVPPGGYDLLPEDAARVGPLLIGFVGDQQAGLILELNRSFEAHHPDEPFHYLSLLGTHPDRRGRGLGMGLVERHLAELDELGEPSLLESSNPANHGRYERLGYSLLDEWNAPSGGPPIAVMWRDPR